VLRAGRRLTLLFRISLALALAQAASGSAARSVAPAVPATLCSGLGSGRLLRLQGSVSEGGLSGRYELLLDQATGRFVEQLTYPVFTMGSGYDGSIGWLEDVSGASHYLNAEFAIRLARSDAWLARRGWCTSEGARTKLRFLGKRRSGRSQLLVWRAVPAGGAPIELGFDAKSGLLKRSTEQQSESRLITNYSNWKRVAGGRWIAFREDRNSPEDESITTVRIANTTLGGTARGVSFGPPPIPNDHRIIGSIATSVSYEDDARTRVYVPVLINGAGPFTFELDSGGHLILTSETAEALHLHAVGELSSTNASGVMKAGYVHLNELRIGNAILANQPAKILPLSPSSSDRSPHPPRAGIIGLELFERFVVGIDRRSKTLTLSLPRSGVRHNGSSLPLSFVEDAPFIDATYAGVSGPFMLDTGNAGRTIIENFWATRNGLLTKVKTGLTLDDGVYRCDAFSIGPFRLPHEIIGYFGAAKSGPESTRFAAGIFGEPLLSRFNTTYNYHDGKVWLERLPEVETKPFDRTGLLLSKKTAQPFVVDGFVAGAAAKSQLNAGDRIVSVNGRLTAGMSRADAAPFFSGPAKRIELEVSTPDGTLRHVSLLLQDVLPCSDLNTPSG
jgi:hypothetical protein